MANSINNGVINLFEKDQIPRDGHKYSQLLEEFILPFENAFQDDLYLDDVFSFAISAWNFACLKNVMPVEEFKKVMASAPDNAKETKLLIRMIDHKCTAFREYDRFIADFELKDSDGQTVLTVVTQDKETYLKEMMSEAEIQKEVKDFEENYIDRSAIVLRPQAPFYDWHNALFPQDPVQKNVANSYLVDFFDQTQELEKWLSQNFDYFFTSELDHWEPDKKKWPKNRSYKMFKIWFEIIICPDVYDTEQRPVFKND